MLKFYLEGLIEIIGATRAKEGSVDWIALVVRWMQTLGSQPVMPKISPITWTRGLPPGYVTLVLYAGGIELKTA